MGNRILVVDDEKEIADVIELYLKNEGFEVEKFYTGKDAIVSIEKAAPDMALLDVMLPDIDGFEVLQKIREKYNFPVIMLTAKTEYMDKINGLMLGADATGVSLVVVHFITVCRTAAPSGGPLPAGHPAV